MTRQDAIEWVEKAKAETTAIAKDIPTTGEYANSLITAIELVDALDMAIEALEEKYPCGLCKWYGDEDWGVCQYCPAEPKGSDEE